MKPCTQRNRLAQFLADDLPENELKEIADHIETCALCQDTLDPWRDPSPHP